MSDTTPPSGRTPQWQSVFDNVPPDFLMELVKIQKHYKLENLTKGRESLVDEVFRVCDKKTLDSLSEQFIGLEGPVWYYRPKADLTKDELLRSVRANVTSALSDGLQPSLGQKPTLYKVEHRGSTYLFRFAAKDQVKQIRVGFTESATIEGVSFYTSVLHFSNPQLVIVGPFTSEKANAVASEFQESLKSDVAWECAKPKRGKRRSFYSAMKSALRANLADTRRHDPMGDYETIAMEARSKQPDIEKVPSFHKYVDAESIYDVLEFKFMNPVGIPEKTHVKFGSPFGRFSFRTRTSLAAIRHFETILYAVLS